MAQELIDQGILNRTDAPRTRWANVLSSAIGGHAAAPVVTHMDQFWGQVGLLCSDGLTKHVSDERIAERLRTMTSARQVCEDLLNDALEDGGSDNITILVGRTAKKATDPGVSNGMAPKAPLPGGGAIELSSPHPRSLNCRDLDLARRLPATPAGSRHRIFSRPIPLYKHPGR